RVDGSLVSEVAAGVRGGDLGDVAHLVGEIAGHEVDVVGEVLPHAGHAAHLGLPAQIPLGAHFARHAGHFTGERVELVHHRVDGVIGSAAGRDTLYRELWPLF